MENRVIKTEDLKLARVKYFDTEHNGAELTDIEAYVFLQKVGDEYANVFELSDPTPVLDRVPYSNYTKDEEPFGTRLVLVNGELSDGACYVIEPVKVDDMLESKKADKPEEVSLEDLTQYVIASDMFFVDRINLIMSQNKPKLHKAVLKRDRKRMDELQQYLSGHGKGYQYVK